MSSLRVIWIRLLFCRFLFISLVTFWNVPFTRQKLTCISVKDSGWLYWSSWPTVLSLDRHWIRRHFTRQIVLKCYGETCFVLLKQSNGAMHRNWYIQKHSLTFIALRFLAREFWYPCAGSSNLNWKLSLNLNIELSQLACKAAVEREKRRGLKARASTKRACTRFLFPRVPITFSRTLFPSIPFSSIVCRRRLEVNEIL